jgi:hypothetical protein
VRWQGARAAEGEDLPEAGEAVLAGGQDVAKAARVVGAVGLRRGPGAGGRKQGEQKGEYQ